MPDVTTSDDAGDGLARRFPQERPAWLTSLEPEPGALSDVWTLLVVHIANTANESGFFAPTHPDWLGWSGLTAERSLRLAHELAQHGALERHDDRWYVVRWREVYRQDD